MPTQREWRQRDVARADQQLLDRAATFLRTDQTRQQWAGLQHVHVAIRWQARESCRALLGEPVASPVVRRTRRR